MMNLLKSLQLVKLFLIRYAKNIEMIKIVFNIGFIVII